VLHLGFLKLNVGMTFIKNFLNIMGDIKTQKKIALWINANQ